MLRGRHYYPNFTDEKAEVLERLWTRTRESSFDNFLIIAGKLKSKQVWAICSYTVSIYHFGKKSTHVCWETIAKENVQNIHINAVLSYSDFVPKIIKSICVSQRVKFIQYYQVLGDLVLKLKFPFWQKMNFYKNPKT